MPDHSTHGGIRDAIIAFLALILLVASTAAIATCCSGAEVTLGWTAHANAEEEAVRAYRVYRVAPAPRALLGVSDRLHLTVNAGPGDALAVAAFNGVEGPLSATIIVPLPPVVEPVMVKLHVYQTTDLKTRKVLATIYVKREQADFFQLGIEP